MIEKIDSELPWCVHVANDPVLDHFYQYLAEYIDYNIQVS